MNDQTKPRATPPAEDYWSAWHFISLALIVVFFVYMAIWRPLGLFASWIMVMTSLAVFILIAGHGIEGVWRGAFMDSRNKVSLSRFQMLVWTILILPAYATMVIARTEQDALNALDIGIPNTLLLLMGISTVSLVGSPLVKSTKEGKIHFNASKAQAKWGDLFTGEEEGDVGSVDLAKIQMFLFTVLIVLAYGSAIGELLQSQDLPSGFPEVGEGMVVLLGISHAGYLTHKAIPRPEDKPTGPAATENQNDGT